MLTLVLIVILAALVFEFVNGFHDTANSIATVVATKVLAPGWAVALAAVMNLIGALTGTAVAATIASGIINTDVVDASSQVILCALLGGIVWNLITWWKGLPSSSSHALIGGLCGAALAAAHNNWVGIDLVRVGRQLGQEQGPAVEGVPADDHFADRRLPAGRAGDAVAVGDHRGDGQGGRAARAAGASALGECVLRQGADPFRGLHGLCAWPQRCAEDHGRHRADAVRC